MRLLSLCVLAGGVMFAAARAHADWRTDLSVKEQPNHLLEVWGPGHFSVGFGEGAYLFVDGGLTRQTDGGSPAGIYHQQPEDCFVSVSQEPGGNRSAVGADGGPCGPNGLPLVPDDGQVVRMKHAQDGGAVAVVAFGSGDKVAYASTRSAYDSSSFYSVPLSGTTLRPSGVLGVARVGSAVYGLLGSTLTNSNVNWIDLNNPTWLEPRSQAGLPSAVVQAIEVFSAGEPARPYAVVGTQHALLQGSLASTPEPIRPVLQLGDDAGVLGVSMNVGAGSAAGRGFGMAIVGLSDGGREVLSPVPSLSATDAGTVWRVRSVPKFVTEAPLMAVACAEASYCVFSADKADGGNLFVYTNDASPELSVLVSDGGVVDAGTSGTESVVMLDEGGRYQLTFSAKDLDGDPVLVTAPPPGGSTGGWTAVRNAGQLPGELAVWDVTTAPACESRMLGSFTVSASDGLARHDAIETVNVYVKHAQSPEPPTVVFADGGTLPSSGAVSQLLPGGPPLTLRMVGGGTTAAGCVLHPKWEPLFSGTGVPSLAQDGGTAVITPPDKFCSPTAGSFGFQLSVTDDGGLSNARTFSVSMAPWGSRPNAVFDAGSSEELEAGESRVLEPLHPIHVCMDGTSPAPEVATEWHLTLPDGSAPGDGITFRDEGTRFVVATPECIDADLVVTARHQLVSAEDLTGPVSQHHLRVRAALRDFDEGSLLLDPEVSASGELRVDVDSNLNCPTRRGLRAEVWLERQDGGVLMVPEKVSIPGTWKVPLGTGCGRPLLLKGVMEDDGGQRSTVLQQEVSTLRVDAGLAPLPEGAALVARCGEQARATLTQTFPPGTCQTPEVTWVQERDGGPALEQDVLSGATVSLATRETGLDSLVGKSVRMQVTASAGPDNEVSHQLTVPITVEPFVRVRRRTELPAVSETGLVGVSVDLFNTTSCGVTGVSYVERLEGLTYVEGSAKFDGQSIEATWESGALTVTGLTLAGESTGKLTYVARPHLVGDRRMEGDAFLGTEVISMREPPGPQVPDTGCGCSGSGPGPVLFALGALVAAVRRRRTRPTGRS
ncbi:MYXO-CTERM sorting domain-containing protein [Archangium gephyra]|uniref:MYXO-CTERM domain-containing protein n=1 Tax=Archangium gephyra TaxID=48 RepID=A0AAC8TEG5_9BACT|nr:MYXO-CTERM sorting domain-containing protein [Archangium gephyra]AKJ02847.1 Hypothetical protein AA314_04473 [Archangium gephyra]